jgi:hypothetical protein
MFESIWLNLLAGSAFVIIGSMSVAVVGVI